MANRLGRLVKRRYAAALSRLVQSDTDRVAQTLEAERVHGLKLAAWLRLAALVVVGALMTAYYVELGGVDAVYWAQLAGLALVWLLGVAQYRAVRRGLTHPLLLGLFPLADALLLLVLTMVPATLAYGLPAPYLQYDRPFILFILLLVLQGLAHRPWLAAWSGVAMGGVWLGAMAWMLATPGAHRDVSVAVWQQMIAERDYTPITDPLLVRTWAWEVEVLVSVVVGFMLAAMVARSQRLIRRSVVADRARANLARFFSPGMVDRLERLEGLDRAQRATIGVVFADIVGFTRYAETATADEVIALMRDFHGRMVETVFAHDGTLDKFIGDAVMATFGTPVRHGGEALRTLACAQAMVDAVGALNAERVEAGAPPIRVGIGAHFGAVVMGGIGDARRLEFAVLGDAVNVAARLEQLTRSVDGEIVISDALAEAARRDDINAAAPLLAGFETLPASPLRGRDSALGLKVKRRLPQPA